MGHDKSFEDLMNFARIPFLRKKQIDDLRGNSLIDDVFKSLWSSSSASLDPGEASYEGIFLSCPLLQCRVGDPSVGTPRSAFPRSANASSTTSDNVQMLE
jgi:hypothetical protein